MKLLLVALALSLLTFTAVIAETPVWTVDARSSAKFIRPDKVVARDIRGSCGPRDAMSAALSEKHGEEVLWSELSRHHPSGIIAELWQGEQGWTWLFTNRNNESCIVAHGKRAGHGS